MTFLPSDYRYNLWFDPISLEKDVMGVGIFCALEELAPILSIIYANLFYEL